MKNKNKKATKSYDEKRIVVLNDGTVRELEEFCANWQGLIFGYNLPAKRIIH